MKRYLLVDEASGAILTIVGAETEADALQHVVAGQILVSMGAGDTGAFIDDGLLKYDGGSGALVLVADDSPAPGFEGYELAEVVAP